MFSFFTKRDYLVDHLEGFRDIHNHILPGIDDGAKTPEESIQLIKEFGAFGVKDFICTPHIMHNYYDNTPKSIKKSYKILKKALQENKIKDVSITYAAEHMIDDNFEYLLGKDEIVTLDSNHLLIEMSYLQPSINFETAVHKISKKQLFPVFAHPERYQYLHAKKGVYSYYKQIGVKFQLNFLAIGGYYGKNVKKVAHSLLNSSLYDFVGSDVHSQKHLDALKQITLDKSIKTELLRLVENTSYTIL